MIKKRHFTTLLKILFIVLSFTFVFWQADTAKIWGYIKDTNPLYLISAYLIMSLAQIISACRMQFYYKQNGVELGSKFSIGLYFTSMFFNTMLPGGIGGDGYKIYTIGKLTGFSHMRAFQIAISERANGLFALLLLTSLFYIYSGFTEIIAYQNHILFALTILVIPSYLISAKLLVKEDIKTALHATIYSIPIQLLNAAIAFIILIDLGVDNIDSSTSMSYLVIFMLSSVAAILPVTIGGAGLREVTFLYGAKLAGLDAEKGITIAMLFFLVSTICSLNGLLFWHRIEKIFAKK